MDTYQFTGVEKSSPNDYPAFYVIVKVFIPKIFFYVVLVNSFILKHD